MAPGGPGGPGTVIVDDPSENQKPMNRDPQSSCSEVLGPSQPVGRPGWGVLPPPAPVTSTQEPSPQLPEAPTGAA